MKRPDGEQASQRSTPNMHSTTLPFDVSPLLDAAGFKHAFFTRLGGVSKFPIDSLNTAATPTRDDPEFVRENVRRCAETLGVGRDKLYHLSQVHGTDAVILVGTEDPSEVVRRHGDMTASRTAGVACGVRSADCVPVLMGDRNSGAVVAVHSGWKGTVANAVGKGASVLRSLATNPSIVAAVGPHIETCCFEVGDDVARDLARASSARQVVIERNNAKSHVSLRRIIRAQLVDAGVDETNIDDVLGCTVCNAERYFSYRRDADKSGRMLSAIVASAPRST